MKPTRVEYDLGPNEHGQPVKLVRDGKQWTLSRHPANQMDDGYGMHLTIEQLAALGEIAKDQTA